MGNQYTSMEDRIESLRKTVKKHIPEWEFVSKDGLNVTVRNVECHHERTINYNTLMNLGTNRYSTDKLKCKICAKAETKRKHEAKKEETAANILEERIQRMKGNLQKHYPQFEYVSGFTTSEGKIVVRYKDCGHTKEISLISVRHDNVKVECQECLIEQKEKEKIQRHKRIEYQRFMNRKPVNEDQMQMKECSYCGAFYFGFEKDRFCSDECRQRNSKRNANRYRETKKKRCRTDESKYINLVSLYQRDKGICWLCGKPCDMSLDTNDNYYPSIDHVVPVSKGGMDRWDNVRLAHRICNMIKSNMIGMGEIENALTTYSLIPK